KNLVELRLALEPDAWKVTRCHTAAGDHRIVGEATGGLELSGVGLVAAQLEGCGDVQRDLVSAVRDAPAGGPTVLGEHVQETAVLRQPVAQGRVDLYEVAVRAHTAVADQVPCVLQREQVLTGGDGVAVVLRQCRV